MAARMCKHKAGRHQWAHLWKQEEQGSNSLMETARAGGHPTGGKLLLRDRNATSADRTRSNTLVLDMDNLISGTYRQNPAMDANCPANIQIWDELKHLHTSLLQLQFVTEMSTMSTSITAISPNTLVFLPYLTLLLHTNYLAFVSSLSSSAGQYGTEAMLHNMLAFPCSEGYYSSKDSSWTTTSGCPDFTKLWSPGAKEECATFLNNIVLKVDSALPSGTAAALQWWTATNSVHSVEGGGGRWRPNLVLISASSDNPTNPKALLPANWRSVHALAELTDREKNSVPLHEQLFQLMGWASFLRAAKDCLLHILGFALRGASFTLLCIDQGINIIVKDIWHDVCRLLTEGTIVHLLEAKGVKGIPRFISEEKVQASRQWSEGIDGQPPPQHNCTCNICNSLNTIEIKVKERNAALADPSGALIMDFNCLEELPVITIDHITKSEDIFDEASSEASEESNPTYHDCQAKILDAMLKKVVQQQDIIQQAQTSFSSTSIRSHNVLGWEIEVALGTAHETFEGLAGQGWAGTEPFMAVEIQNTQPGEPIQHAAHHDLESFYYIILAICALLEQPYQFKVATFMEQEVIRKWLNPELDNKFTRVDVDHHKFTMFSKADNLRSFLNGHISHYFVFIVLYLERLCSTIFGSAIFVPERFVKLGPAPFFVLTPTTHTSVLQILLDTLCAIQGSKKMWRKLRQPFARPKGFVPHLDLWCSSDDKFKFLAPPLVMSHAAGATCKLSYMSNVYSYSQKTERYI
ncbi:hypothetical protein SERLADRAFT_405948 [Serpula lacrymans var. lacrymans S7.9]|uniref:Fungal-type protein kinase domain-containing protein n=1 Tax=Serpula lacrymans var. lacrymans (strain S7.9) TaxID=578457 RepID=F8NKD4_SERL9|nr:uncharacterized protein SERLADRAFT_405948 [Serpula lacrymans var. lacrymans S7.9]EGO28400.1 hypothetical protein SERLADRAFT_405948 [Serpula lacrymans var. lacrymans S7.9]